MKGINYKSIFITFVWLCVATEVLASPSYSLTPIVNYRSHSSKAPTHNPSKLNTKPTEKATEELAPRVKPEEIPSPPPETVTTPKKSLTSAEALAMSLQSHEAIFNSLGCSDHPKLFISYVQGLKNFEVDSILTQSEFEQSLEEASKSWCEGLSTDKNTGVHYLTCRLKLKKKIKNYTQAFYSKNTIIPDDLFLGTYREARLPCIKETYAHLVGVSNQDTKATEVQAQVENVSPPPVPVDPNKTKIAEKTNPEGTPALKFGGGVLDLPEFSGIIPQAPFSAEEDRLAADESIPEPKFEPAPVAAPSQTSAPKPQPAPAHVSPAVPSPARAPAKKPEPKTEPQKPQPLPAFVREDAPDKPSRRPAPAAASTKNDDKPKAQSVTIKKDACDNGPLDWEKIIAKQTTQHQKNFLRKLGARVEKVAKKNGIPMDALLGLMAEESGWGRSKLATRYNNYGGIKQGRGSGTTPLMATLERGSPTKERFSTYASIDDYMVDKVNFFKKDRYKHCQTWPLKSSFAWAQCIGHADYFNGTKAAQTQWARRIDKIAGDLREAGAVCL